MNSLNQLEQHCCRHFMKELAEQFSSLMDDLRCSLCNTVFKQKHKLLLHIGCKHGKINDILKKKGFAVLPAPVLSTTNHAMQKQLVKVCSFFRLFYSHFLFPRLKRRGWIRRMKKVGTQTLTSGRRTRTGPRRVNCLHHQQPPTHHKPRQLQLSTLDHFLQNLVKFLKSIQT